MKVCYPIFRMRSLKEVDPNLQRVEAMLDRGFDLIRLYVGASHEADVAFLKESTNPYDGRVTIKSWDSPIFRTDDMWSFNWKNCGSGATAV